MAELVLKLTQMKTFQVQLENLITNLVQVIKYAEDNNLTNTQEFINFLDKINELSVLH